jgi:hypothetical protein
MGERPPKVVFPLVHELADDGIPVAVACRVLNTSRSGYYDWPGRPEPPRDLRNKGLLKVTGKSARIPAAATDPPGSMLSCAWGWAWR